MSYKLKQKAKERLSRERGYILKPFGAHFNIALVYPNRYLIGMSNLGFQKVYSLFNQRGDINCERAFLPEEEEIPQYQNSRVPLFSLESQTDLSRFDVLAFSVTYEMDYPNLLQILELARIPLLADERTERHPLILAGGLCPTMNPEPLAPFVDAFYIGEAEPGIDTLADVLVRKRSLNREAYFRELARVPGLYVASGYDQLYGEGGTIAQILVKPGFPEKVERMWSPHVDQSPTMSTLITQDQVFGDMVLVEMGKGCGRHCRFCALGYLHRPPRNYSRDVVIGQIRKALAIDRKVGLVGSQITDHPHLEEICDAILEEGGEFSVSSVQIDKLSDRFIAQLAAGGNRTLTMAPEAGSWRLRKILNKDYSDDVILSTLDRVVRAGIPNTKFYFLVGIPNETDEDVEAIVSLGKRMRHAYDKAVKGKPRSGSVTLSVNPFIPKASTPWQWEPMDEVDSLNRKIKSIKTQLRKVPGVYVNHEIPKWSYIQTLLSVGDRRAGRLMARAHERNWNWREAFKESDLNPDFFVYRRKSREEILPWAAIDEGIKSRYLALERIKSEHGEVTTSCSHEQGACRRCGNFQGVCHP